jgi:Flp pilus assembly protein TadG
MTRHLHLRRRKRGSAIVEFALAGMAGVTLLTTTVQVALVMWNYHTLAYAVHETNRYIASHGRSCTTGGNACAITVANIVAKLKEHAVGIPDTTLNMTLTTQSGVVKDCRPVSTCASDSTQWPPVPHLDNNPGAPTKITAKVTLHPAIIILWVGTAGAWSGEITLPATSNIPIVF